MYEAVQKCIQFWFKVKIKMMQGNNEQSYQAEQKEIENYHVNSHANFCCCKL